jgi:peptidoglycan/xylan/chitin deacetylase (PgdA/CDA1 family)
VLRTILKKTFYYVYLYSGYVAVRDFLLALSGRSRVVVLNYHRVEGLDTISKPLEHFIRDIDYLARRYRCISFTELIELLRSGQPLRRSYRVITFDDGYRDNFTLAYPALAKAKVPAIFFVSTGFIGTDRIFPYDTPIPGAPAPRGRPNMTWDDLREMQAAGYEIGSHTVNHANLGLAGLKTIRSELMDSMATLDRELGARPRAFAFPWGTPEAVPEAAFPEIKSAGYYAAAVVGGGCNRAGGDPFKIRRIDAGNGSMGWLELRVRMAGFDPDHFVRGNHTDPHSA